MVDVLVEIDVALTPWRKYNQKAYVLSTVSYGRHPQQIVYAW